MRLNDNLASIDMCTENNVTMSANQSLLLCLLLVQFDLATNACINLHLAPLFPHFFTAGSMNKISRCTRRDSGVHLAFLGVNQMYPVFTCQILGACSCFASWLCIQYLGMESSTTTRFVHKPYPIQKLIQNIGKIYSNNFSQCIFWTPNLCVAWNLRWGR